MGLNPSALESIENSGWLPIKKKKISFFGGHWEKWGVSCSPLKLLSLQEKPKWKPNTSQISFCCCFVLQMLRSWGTEPSLFVVHNTWWFNYVDFPLKRMYMMLYITLMPADSTSCGGLGRIHHEWDFLTGIKKVKTGDVPALLVTNHCGCEQDSPKYTGSKSRAVYPW